MIQEIEQALVNLLSEVSEVRNIITHPMSEVGRTLPALVLVYEGFDERLQTNETGRITLRWKATLVWALDGKSTETVWVMVKQVADRLINVVRNNATLNGLVHGLLIDSGEPVIGSGDGYAYIGHSFTISVWKTIALNMTAMKVRPSPISDMIRRVNLRDDFGS